MTLFEKQALAMMQNFDWAALQRLQCETCPSFFSDYEVEWLKVNGKRDPRVTGKLSRQVRLI